MKDKIIGSIIKAVVIAVLEVCIDETRKRKE